MEPAFAEQTVLDTSQHVENPYLIGAYAPIMQERMFPKLKVIGEIPKDLFGAYFRNGPNPKYTPKGRYHWFDGDGMIHAMHFANGEASYRNRWVQTEGLTAEDGEQRGLFSGLIEPDLSNPLGYIKDNANTDVVYHNKQLLSLFYRSGKPYGMDPNTLETHGPQDFGGLTHPISAHAKVDERTGELMIFDYGPKAPYMYYGVVSADGQLVNWVPIELPGQRFPHDMAITQNYSILMDMPVMFDPQSLKKGKFRMSYFPQIQTRFALIPRHGKAQDIRWFDADPCYIYHVINAWEEGETVVMDVCRVSEPIPERDANDTELDRMKRMLAQALQSARYHRYRFNLTTGSTNEEQLFDVPCEFPTVNLGMMGYSTRYSYHMTLPPVDTLLFDGIVKYDTATNKEQFYGFGPGRWGSETPFAPKIGATTEDDGYLLSFIHDMANNQSECIILDAQDLERGPLARVLIPQRVPMGFHATWVAGDRL